MDCEDIQAHAADYVAGTLPDGVATAAAEHLQSCRVCAAELDGLAATWDLLAAVPGHRPPSAAMKVRIEATLEGYRLGMDRHATTSPLIGRASWWVAAAAIAVLAVAIGRQTAPTAAPDSQMTQLRDELRALKEMTAIALLQQTSPSDRLKGVTWTGQIEEPGQQVVAVLLDTLMRDPNVNVRLAVIDALERFADRDAVRRGALEALNYESSPLVLIALIDFAAEANGAAAAEALERISSDRRINEAARARAAAMLKRVG